MFCPNCGKQMPDDARFCDGCGNSFNEQARTVPPVYAAVPPPMANPTMQQPYAAQGNVPQAAFYQQPVYPMADLNKPMTVGACIGMLLLQCIPLVGIIMLFVWAFGSNVNVNKKNWSRAMLIIAGIGLVLYIIIAVVFAGIFASLFSDMFSGYNFNY
jgi:predicted nucleic acid-binding Zn ribbon protein